MSKSAHTEPLLISIVLSFTGNDLVHRMFFDFLHYIIVTVLYIHLSFSFRYSHTSHIIDDKLWIIGGVDLSIPSDVLVINLRNWNWREYRLQVSKILTKL